MKASISSEMPSSTESFFICSSFSSTTSTGSSAMRPPMGSGRSANTLPSRAMARPPPFSITRLPARTMSSSVTPAMTRLWESCPMLVATAPFFKPYFPKNPSPTWPVFLCRSMAASLRCRGLYLHREQRLAVLSTLRSALL